MTAEEVARRIRKGVERRRRLLLMDAEGRFTHLLKKFSPALVDRLFYWVMARESNSPIGRIHNS